MNLLVNDKLKSFMKYAVLGLVPVLMCLEGCGSPLGGPETMVPEEISRGPHLGQSVRINVVRSYDVSADTDKIFIGEGVINADIFAEAVEMAVIEAGLFDEVLPTGLHPRFHLDIDIVHAEGKPGLTRFSKSPGVFVARWKLVDNVQGKTCFDEQITSAFELQSSGSIYRGNRALEGAAKENIAEALNRFARRIVAASSSAH